VRGCGEEGLRDALARTNLKPEEVDKLIITHLHFDHAANARLFHNARIYVQRKGWESALNPPIHHRRVYDKELIFLLEDMDLCLVDGDKEVADGIKVVLLPGHTKGLQGVLVKTAKGDYLIAGDHFYSFVNISPPRQPIELVDSMGGKVQIPAVDMPFLPPGLHVDLTEWYDSCFKALSYARRMNTLPGHEPLIDGSVFP